MRTGRYRPVAPTQSSLLRAAMALPEPDQARPLAQTAAFFAAQVAILVFANWARPDNPDGLWWAVWQAKWWLTALAAAGLLAVLTTWFGLPWRSAVLPGVTVVGSGALFSGHPAVPFTSFHLPVEPLTTCVAASQSRPALMAARFCCSVAA